jgi:hypothetical protein
LVLDQIITNSPSFLNYITVGCASVQGGGMSLNSAVNPEARQTWSLAIFSGIRRFLEE